MVKVGDVRSLDYLIVTSQMPPARNGIGDYVQCLSGALASRGHRVGVASRNEAGSRDARIAYFTLAQGGLSFARQTARIAHARGVRWVLWQYQPFLYGRRGFPIFVHWLGRILHRSGSSRLAVNLHELWYPWRGAGLVGRVRHVHNRLAFAMLVRSADRTVVTCERWRDLVRSHIRGQSTEVIPVGSNLPIVRNSDRADALVRSVRVDRREVRVGFFGTRHPGRDSSWVLRAFALASGRVRLRLVVVGEVSDEVQQLMSHLSAEVRGRIQLFGHVPAGIAAALLERCDLMAAPFIDGVSQRRTTAIAALGLGLPLFASATPFTDSVFRDRRGVLLAPADREGFAANLLAWAARVSEVRNRRRAARALYDERFSWNMIAAAFERACS